jgi:hypothetical protein
MNRIVSTLHTATHLVPGVPEHSDKPTAQRLHGTSASSRPHANRQHVHSHDRHHQAPPRVLVKWQNWIGGLVGRDSDR